MNYNIEEVQKAIKCAMLLPPPGDEEVKKFAIDWLELTDKNADLQVLLKECLPWLERFVFHPDQGEYAIALSRRVRKKLEENNA
jgi:hypothetical protein